ncbi:hypothetical protein FPQ10_06085 [Allobacillus sp. SKP2-8]|uniref:hypothetical protein n=1 Tax=unclassified Allobacillus TaxID=2628859 RepID=UPI001182DF73|nr:hypothetical protein [Allobacillus sp. SKP2-8]TSJ67364.1 hypothetical protein FPQ10_06085 [Allobacillus sp. SKP2-8]
MQDKDDKLKDASKSGFGLLSDSVLNASTNAASEIAKESVSDMVGEMAIDTVSSFIPGISGAISSYKIKRAEKNLTILINEVSKRQERITANLSKQTEENKDKLDQLLQYIIELAADEYQEQKIEYMVNGYLYLTDHNKITSDFVMHYYDTLKQLRMVDISVLRLYYKNAFLMPTERENFRDIMEKHGLSYEQYRSVQETLRRHGLLELEVKDETENDMTKLEEGINKVVAFLEHLNKGKNSRPPQIGKVKIKQKTRESFKLNKFGKEFNDFFHEG